MTRATGEEEAAKAEAAPVLACDLRVREGGFEVVAAFSSETVPGEGGVLALFGPTGAGKTILLRTLAGLVAPHAGTLRLGARTFVDVERGVFLRPQERLVGYAPQHAPMLPQISVRANVLLGRPGGARAPLDEALVEATGIGPLLPRAPAGLSGGERQRVALARAVARGPRLLLLDEPLSALHRPARRRLLAWLLAWARHEGVAIVLVTHDEAEALAADRVVLVESGRATEAGPPGEMLARLDARNG